MMFASGWDWISVSAIVGRKKTEQILFRFQYKGLYPALEEAARSAPGLRDKWEHLVENAALGWSDIKAAAEHALDAVKRNEKR